MLPDSTAEQIVVHVTKVWERGQAVLQMVRDQLGTELADKLVPLVNGGVGIHKILGVMHDTCNAANKVAHLMGVLKRETARAHYGDEMFEGKEEHAKVTLDFLCGNHSRNLLVVRFDKAYEEFMEVELGEAIRAARQATGGRVRLECSGAFFLRSICRLTHRGHAQYVKGDGDAFADFLEANYPNHSNACVSRGDHSNRQDWSLEAAYEIFPLLGPLLDYEIKSLLGEANVLRDSILIQLETLHFEAYVHVSAVMWRVIFKELRGLTNSKGLELNPIELNILYEKLYDVGTLLQTEDALKILEPSFRPWPHIFQNNGRSKKFYTNIEKTLASDMKLLRSFCGRADEEKYRLMLLAVFKLFGKGIVDSLEYTMKDYLKQTNGEYQTEGRPTWELEAASKMLCHNNAAERPFAVLRQYKRMYPSLSLGNLCKLIHSIINQTHRPASNVNAAGIAISGDPILRECVSSLCQVRTKTIGKITKFIRAAHRADSLESKEVPILLPILLVSILLLPTFIPSSLP